MATKDSAEPSLYIAQIQEIIQAASSHDNGRLKTLINDCKFPGCDAVDVQDALGNSPLHAAIAACGKMKVAQPNGESAKRTTEDDACDTVRFLLENGAIWNQLNKENETPGCIAYRLGLSDAYQLMVDAGVRAEILLNRLDEYEKLEDDDETTEEQAKDGDEVPELIENVDQITQSTVADGTTSSEYLSSTLSLTGDRILDEQQNGVMMAWESNIMKQSAESLLPQPKLKILNIGAGMMIFDSHVQQSLNRPSSHHIVEAHPDILANIRAQGWDQKPGVTIHAGRWQDVLPQLLVENETFDAIYYDTFAESYADFKEFFTEFVLELLDQNGKWSYFNGMGADRQISYDVYQKVVELDLFEAGFDVEWIEVDLPQLDQEWEGVKRKYWNVDKYRLPLCRFMN